RLYGSGPPPALAPSPTRRSSDLAISLINASLWKYPCVARIHQPLPCDETPGSGTAVAGPHHAGTWHRPRALRLAGVANPQGGCRSEEHTSELQSRENLVCRLLLE